jgi:hypothetical protein
VLKPIKRNQDRFGNHASGILKLNERLPLVLNAPRNHGSEFRSFE